MSLRKAIDWRWPGARCVVHGDVLERWDGPMAEPSESDIAQALAAYTAQQPVIDADTETDHALTNPELSAVISWVAEVAGVSATVATRGVRKHLRRINRKQKETS